MKLKIYCRIQLVLTVAIVSLFSFSVNLIAQEIGANFNHSPGIIDFKYVERSQVDWIRTTPEIFNYINGSISLGDDSPLNKVVEAGQRGYKIAFGFRWHFKDNSLRIPQPNSAEEQLYFKYADSILKKVGPYVDIFKLGNEPQWETHADDMKADGEGEIPLVRFTQRFFSHVVYPYFSTHNGGRIPGIYVGSIPALYRNNVQKMEAVQGLIEYAQSNDSITGLSLHLHVETLQEAGTALQYARSLVPNKPFIVPEFSFQSLFKSKLEEIVGNSTEGNAFATNYGVNPQWKLYEYYSHINTNKISKEEWDDFFATRSWFPDNYLLDFHDLYNQYGVVLATFPLLQQSAPKSIDPSTLIWFINPIYGQKSLVNQPNGDYSINATSFYDYITIVNKGRIIKPVFYFPFEDDLKDASGNEFELKGSNAPIYTTGTIGKAVRLDGSSDYFDITQQGMINTGASPFTVCAWVYNTQTSAEREGDPDAEIIIHQLQGRVVLQHLVGTNQSTLGTWIGGASHQLTGIEFKPNQWQHVAMVCNPGTKTHTYYIDGKKTGQTTSANAFESVNYGFRIGAHKSGVQAFWHGLIDEVYMFRGELTGAQIKEVMDNKEITDLKENKLDVHELQVYPNPTRDYLTVSGIEAIKEIRLIGMDGRTVKRYDDSINIYMGNIFKGYYFIQVETIDGNRYLNKLIII